MKSILSTLLIFNVALLAELKLENSRLDTTTAIKILDACHHESLLKKVKVAIVIVGLDGDSCKFQK